MVRTDPSVLPCQFAYSVVEQDGHGDVWHPPGQSCIRPAVFSGRSDDVSRSGPCVRPTASGYRIACESAGGNSPLDVDDYRLLRRSTSPLADLRDGFLMIPARGRSVPSSGYLARVTVDTLSVP